MFSLSEMIRKGRAGGEFGSPAVGLDPFVVLAWFFACRVDQLYPSISWDRDFAL